MKTIRILQTREEIEDACAILYEVYIEKYQWDFCLNNPSKIRIETRNNKKLLVDKYVDKAVWFGVFKEEKLVGCSRVQGKGDENLLAIEEYESSKIIRPFIKGRQACVELAKFAFLSNHVTPGIIKKLFLALFRYCEQKGYSPLTCTSDGFLKFFYKKIEFPMLMEHAFKYEPSDPLAVNFYFADHAKREVLNIINILERVDKGSNTNSTKIFKALEIAAPVLPVPVYWHDKHGVLLGINEHGLKGMGTSRQIVGKTPYEFYPQSTAEHILKHHNLVMNRGEILAQEERINDITTGKEKYFSAIKAPLYDDEGVTIGIVGTSIDITAEKESERLKVENEKLEIMNQFQNKLIEEQKGFKKIIDQAVHDIRSPLASLMIVSKYTKNIPADFCAVISGASKRIDDIARHLLQIYMPKNNMDQIDHLAVKSKDNFQVLLALYEIISEKKYEFHDLPVEFKISLGKNGYSAFIFAEEFSFKRMISNLINNAVEAFENKPGSVTVHLHRTNTSVDIIIEDNGKGMPEHIVNKIMNGISVTEGKREGNGIGFTQVREALQSNEGYLDIESTVGTGTKVILTFPKTQCPLWMAEKIELSSEDIVVVIDDDSSILNAWKIRLKEQAPDTVVHLYGSGTDALLFLDKLSLEQKNKTIVLADYELLGQDFNGLQLIEKSRIKRSFLVTSHYNNHEVLNELKKTNVKLLPKLFISEIPILTNLSPSETHVIQINCDKHVDTNDHIALN